MKLVVLSGKGGTGKTTVAVSLSELMDHAVMVDCDVDAANMHLYYDGETLETRDYMGSKMAFVDQELCNQCGICTSHCTFDAIVAGQVDPLSCEGCGVCEFVCPQDAITLKPVKGAEMKLIKTEKGIIAKADMEIGAEGSGKLITELKAMAAEYTKDGDITVIDGSPGVGCPVIASITGAHMTLLVIEPTKSGLSDFLRVEELCSHFAMPVMVCINKYDMNLDVAKEIEEYCLSEDIDIVGKIPFDNTVMRSINELVPIVKYEDSIAGKAIIEMWQKIKTKLNLEV